MIHDLEDVRQGFETSADVVVIGSGPGGAVAALNLAQAGLKTVVIEAGPRVDAAEMTRDAPLFMARYFWEGGLRLVHGTVPSPSMAARCLGGGSVVNSAIMFELPGWVRDEWVAETQIDLFRSEDLHDAYRRVFARTKTSPTGTMELGLRNTIVKTALEKAGLEGGPLPRAVAGCEGSSDCMTGCAVGAKQSVDRSYLRDAENAGAEIFTCAEVDQILMEGDKTVGVAGWVVDPRGRVRQKRFQVRASRVVVAAGAMHTPVLLQRSGIHANKTAGRTLFAHIGAGFLAFHPDVMDPWVGASQGWGAFSKEIKGLKYEGLWASPSAILVRWGGLGASYFEQLQKVKRASCVALVYRGKVRGRVKARRDGTPDMKLWIPDSEAHTVFRGMKIAVDAMLGAGAEHVDTCLRAVPAEIRNTRDSEALLSKGLRAKDLRMTLNHVFGTCRMSADPKTGTVDETGKVRGVEGVYLADASVFPSPSAVNPQATVMALADVISRGIGEIHA